MHYKNVNGILSNQNTMNLYRGCQHGCIYCDSRSACYHFDHDFEDIEVKENALVLLENCLKHKRKKCMIQMGSMCDPYMPLENELNHVRKALELIDHYGFGVTLITKSDLVLRDVDLLKKINQKTKCVVQMTLTTYDEELCQKLEPHVCTTKKRIEVLKELNKQGIPTIVWLTPILPFINDTKENIVAICKGAVPQQDDLVLHRQQSGARDLATRSRAMRGHRRVFTIYRCACGRRLCAGPVRHQSALPRVEQPAHH